MLLELGERVFNPDSWVFRCVCVECSANEVARLSTSCSSSCNTIRILHRMILSLHILRHLWINWNALWGKSALKVTIMSAGHAFIGASIKILKFANQAGSTGNDSSACMHVVCYTVANCRLSFHGIVSTQTLHYAGAWSICMQHRDINKTLGLIGKTDIEVSRPRRSEIWPTRWVLHEDRDVDSTRWWDLYSLLLFAEKKSCPEKKSCQYTYGLIIRMSD